MDSNPLTAHSASPAAVHCASRALAANSNARSNRPAPIAARDASRNLHAFTARIINGSRSAPQREHTRTPRNRAWHTGHRPASINWRGLP
jgi:hypothetical protein